jgi:hypothetical protein
MVLLQGNLGSTLLWSGGASKSFLMHALKLSTANKRVAMRIVIFIVLVCSN